MDDLLDLALELKENMKMKTTGIDVSHHQNPDSIDYSRIAENHAFLIARAAYGTRPDSTFLDHAGRARAEGLVVGGYTFFRQQQQAQAQIDAFRQQFDQLLGGQGATIVPVVDLEWNTDYDGPLDPIAHNTVGRRIVESLADEYGGVMVYLAPGFWEALGRPDWLVEYPWWVAHWTEQPVPYRPAGSPEYAIWQWTEKGSTPGYGGPLDLNRLRPGQQLADLLVPFRDAVPTPDDVGQLTGAEASELARTRKNLRWCIERAQLARGHIDDVLQVLSDEENRLDEAVAKFNVGARKP